MTIEHTHHGYSLHSDSGCLVHDKFALISVYALWSREEFNSFNNDLQLMQEEWLRKKSSTILNRRDFAFWDVAIPCEWSGLNGSFFPTRDKARQRKRMSRTGLIIVRLDILMFLNRVWVNDVKEIR